METTPPSAAPAPSETHHSERYRLAAAQRSAFDFALRAAYELEAAEKRIFLAAVEQFVDHDHLLRSDDVRYNAERLESAREKRVALEAVDQEFYRYDPQDNLTT